MLAQSAHGWKVNFCKFTNETRNAMEEATGSRARSTSAPSTGPCAGGGYELALATEWIVMADDGKTRPCRSRRSRCSPCSPAPAASRGWSTSAACAATAPTSSARSRRESRRAGRGMGSRRRGRAALGARRGCGRRAAEFAARTDRPAGARGVALTPLERSIDGDRIRYRHVACDIDRGRASPRSR